LTPDREPWLQTKLEDLMRCRALLIPIGLVCCMQPLAAQMALPIGQRVRITSAQHDMQRMIGRVGSTSNDSVTIGLDQGARRDTVALALSDLDRLELGQYVGHRTKRGAVIGFVTGSVIGFLVGAMTYQECVPQGWFDCLMTPRSAEAQGVLGALAGGAVGIGVGGLIGALARAEKWDEIPIRHTTVSVRSLPAGGMGLGLTVHF